MILITYIILVENNVYIISKIKYFPQQVEFLNTFAEYVLT